MIIYLEEGQSVRILKRRNQANLILDLVQITTNYQNIFRGFSECSSLKADPYPRVSHEIQKEILQKKRPSSLLELHLVFYESEQTDLSVARKAHE